MEGRDVLSDEMRLVPGARVLIATADELEARRLDAYLEDAGHTPLLAFDGRQALNRVRQDDPEVALLDIDLPGPNAYQVCERIKFHPTSRFVAVIVVAPIEDHQHRVRGLEVGADDFLARPVDRLDLLARVKSMVRVKRLDEQATTAERMIYSLARLLEAREGSGSSEYIARLACILGEAIGLPDEDLDALRKSSLLHDIGKLAVREEVLLKNGALSRDEYDELRIHPEMGETFCGPLGYADAVLPVIRYQRERWDGEGYPDGLHGEQIPLLARIISIADAYVTMLSPRPYRGPMSPEAAQATLRAGAAKQWDPTLIDIFLAELEKRELVAA
jgi:putative two-component system response regulator